MTCLLIFSNSKPSKNNTRAHNERATVVFAVLVLEKDVDHSSQQRVQEGKDSNGDEELGGGGKVSDQVKPLLSPSLTHRHVKFHPVQPVSCKAQKHGTFLMQFVVRLGSFLITFNN